NALIYSTFLGGNGVESGLGIAIGSNGNAYVVGPTSSTNFPTANPLQAARASGQDGFITQIGPTGSSLVYSTYFGANGNDTVRAIAIDANGNAYVAGSTDSSDFPTLNPFQNAPGIFANDGFVSKLNPAGNGLIYSTYLGGSNDDQCLALALDNSGEVVV